MIASVGGDPDAGGFYLWWLISFPKNMPGKDVYVSPCVQFEGDLVVVNINCGRPRGCLNVVHCQLSQKETVVVKTGYVVRWARSCLSTYRCKVPEFPAPKAAAPIGRAISRGMHHTTPRTWPGCRRVLWMLLRLWRTLLLLRRLCRVIVPAPLFAVKIGISPIVSMHLVHHRRRCSCLEILDMFFFFIFLRLCRLILFFQE